MGSRSAKSKDYAKGVEGAVHIFTRYREFIHAVIRYHIKDEARADDLFQDFFLSLILKPLPTDIRSIKSYLYKMIINDIADAGCRIERYQNQMRRYAARKKYHTTKKSPESALIEMEEMNKMFKLIEEQLPRSEARAVVLRYRNQYSIKEVAGKMNVTSESVSRYISVGISKVRQFLTNRKSR